MFGGRKQDGYKEDGILFHQRPLRSQKHLVGNCSFEPSIYPNIDTVNHCMKEIDTAFKWHKPATISSHRVNYIGSLHAANRSNSLKSLALLLNNILNKWPDVEFITSDKLGNIIGNENRLK